MMPFVEYRSTFGSTLWCRFGSAGYINTQQRPFGLDMFIRNQMPRGRRILCHFTLKNSSVTLGVRRCPCYRKKCLPLSIMSLSYSGRINSPPFIPVSTLQELHNAPIGLIVQSLSFICA